MVLCRYQVGGSQQQAVSAVVAENAVTITELKSCVDELKKVSQYML